MTRARTQAAPVYRFAPSPNGELHLGHAFSAILTHELALRSGGRFLLRIEDIDEQRAQAEFIKAIKHDLAWLGLKWEEPVRRQSDHFGTYRAALGKLERLGLLYPCFATRREISKMVEQSHASRCDPDGVPLYPGIYKNVTSEEINQRRASGEPFALRLDMAKAVDLLKTKGHWPVTFSEISTDGKRETITADPERWGDVVIARKDTPTSYHLSVVVDDAIQQITHITRGRDLMASTDIHRILQIFLELPQPAYHHHRLISDLDGKKLSKSTGSKSLRMLRDEGVNPEEIWQVLGFHGTPSHSN